MKEYGDTPALPVKRQMLRARPGVYPHVGALIVLHASCLTIFGLLFSTFGSPGRC